MGLKNKAPKAPDYAALARIDGEEQRKTAEQITGWNRPNQTDRYGNQLSWSRTPDGGWSQSITMDPTLKNIQDSNVSGYGSRMSELNNQGSFNGGPQAGGNGLQFYSPGGGGGYTSGGAGGSFGDLSKFKNIYGQLGKFNSKQGDRVAEDLYEATMGRARPEMDRQQSGLDVKLRQQGLQPGTEAYNRSMQNMLTSHGDVSTQAGLNSTLAGYNAARDIYNTNAAGQAQNFGQGLQTWQAEATRQGQLANQKLGAMGISAQNNATNASAAAARDQYNLGLARQQSQDQSQNWTQALTQYQLPMNMAQGYADLMNQQPGTSFEGFGGATGYNPASMSNAAQNTYNANMAAANSQNSKTNNLLQSGTTLAGAAILSDVSLKENITPLVGKAALDTIMRLGGYAYDWKDGSGHDMGVLAQQVQEVLPALVVKAEEGRLMVRYTGLVALCVEAIKYLAEKSNE